MIKRGFTLPELLLVISLIGILAAVSWPSLNQLLRKVKIKGQAYRIADQLQAAQERTLAEQNIYGVYLDAAAEQAHLVTYGESYEGVGDPDYTVLESITLEGALIDSTEIVDADSGLAIVRFSRAGTPSYTGLTTITNTSSDLAATWKVAITPAGSIKVYQ